MELHHNNYTARFIEGGSFGELEIFNVIDGTWELDVTYYKSTDEVHIEFNVDRDCISAQDLFSMSHLIQQINALP